MIDSSNPYAMPNAYDVSNIMTGYQRDAQRAESEKLILNEQKRSLAESALARQIKAAAIKGLETGQSEPAQQAPEGMAPQMQPQAAPGSTAFWQGQNTAAPEQAPTTPVQQFKAAKTEYSNISKQAQEYATISKALKAKGLVDQAEQYDAKIMDLQNKSLKAKDDVLDHSIKVLGLAGNLANGYMEAVKNDPASSDAAWARFAMTAKMYGADEDNKLMMTPPDQRQQVAQQIMDQSEDGKTRAMMAREQLKVQYKAKAQLESNELKREIEQSRTRRQADREAGINKRWEAGREDTQFKTLEGSAKSRIAFAQRDRDDIDGRIKEVQTQIDDINSLRNISIPKEQRPDAVAALETKKNVLLEERRNSDKEIDTYEKDLVALQDSYKDVKSKKEPGSKGKPKEFSEKVGYKFVQGASQKDIDLYKSLMSQAKTREEKLEVQKIAFEHNIVEPK
jgi:hypothetical protein